MKTQLQKLTGLGLLPAAVLALSLCAFQASGQDTAGTGVKADEPKDQPATATQPAESKAPGATVVAVRAGEPGGVVVQTCQETATVSSMDKETRKITLTKADGTKLSVKAGPEVVNFDQIQVGDQVKATVADQVVVFVRKSGEPAGEQPMVSKVALAPVGAKPGAIMADTVEVTGKVTEIDKDQRKATVEFPDGIKKTFKVRDDVDLSKAAVGDEVVLRATEALAIKVEKP